MIMRLQLLVAAMHQKDCALYERMNIDSDAIIVNQCGRDAYEEFRFGDNQVKLVSRNERGVGRSRNIALQMADADIVEFADEDMIFTETHREDVLREFAAHPDADVIIFSLESLNPERPLRHIKRFQRICRFQALKYGGARIAARRQKLLDNNISFSLLFGGGARYGSGEDSLFLQDCFRAGLRVYRSPVMVAYVKQQSSSWFRGYTDEYFRAKGALFAALMPVCAGIYAVLTALKFRKPPLETLRIMRLLFDGMAEYRRRK